MIIGVAGPYSADTAEKRKEKDRHKSHGGIKNQKTGIEKARIAT